MELAVTAIVFAAVLDGLDGRVARMGPPWTVWPPLRALGRIAAADAARAEDLSRRMGAALAAECAACGIDCDFAPLMDVDTNPANPIIGDRAFGDDPEAVGRLGVAMIEGLQGGGVIACAKHFPGHGDTSLDSHLDLPVVEHARSRLDDVEIRPFRAAVKAEVATMMMAHVLYPELDAELPASLSAPKLDAGDLSVPAMGVGAIARLAGAKRLEEPPMRPIKLLILATTALALGFGGQRAGCDMIPVCQSHDAQVLAMEGAVRAVEAGEVSFTAMDAALGRIRQLKERYLLPYRDPDPKQARRAAGKAEFLALAQEVAEGGGQPLRFPWTSD